jgi:hypothetical protein
MKNLRIIFSLLGLLLFAGVWYTYTTKKAETTPALLVEAKSFSIPQYGFSFTYSPDQYEVKVFSATQSDFMSVGREFAGVYRKGQYQDYHARIDTYSNTPLKFVVEGDSYIPKNTSQQKVTINGNVWTQIGDYFLIEKNATTFSIVGDSDIVQGILSTVTFAK